MINILDGVRVNERIIRAVATTVETDAIYLTHLFGSDSITLQFNNDANDFRMFPNKDDYIDYLMGMYEVGALFGNLSPEYLEVSKAVLRACKSETYLRDKLEFTFEEMVALTEYYKNGWFSKANMDRWGTTLIKTLPYRMFVTTDKGYNGLVIANLRIITKDGYVVTLVNQIPDEDKAFEVAGAITNNFLLLGSKERAILADLKMVWDTSKTNAYNYAFTFEDFNGNTFTIASDYLVNFEQIN